MPAFIGLFVALVLVLFWCLHELSERKKYALKPSTFSEFLALSRKASTPDSRYPPLYFAASCFFLFSFWEAALRLLIEAQMPSPLIVLGCVALLGALLWRYLRFKGEGASIRFLWSDWLLLFGGFSLVCGYGVFLLCAPWVLWRSWPFLKGPSPLS